MTNDEFRCPRCKLRIGEIEPDGALLMYPGVRVAHADMVCQCGRKLRWHGHEAALDRLVDRVIRMRSGMSIPQPEDSGTGSPAGVLT